MKINKEGLLDVGNGHSIYWAECGNPTGLPLLMIHGGSGHIFDEEKICIDELRYRIIFYHQRGVGLSIPYGGRDFNTVNENIADIEMLRQHLHVRGWNIFSWSFGAIYMSAYAMDHPERCGGLYTYAPYFGSEEDFEASREKDAEALNKYLKANNASTITDLITHSFNKAASNNFEERFQGFFEAVQFSQPDANYKEIFSQKTRDEWEDYLRIRCVGMALELELFKEKCRFLENQSFYHSVRSPMTLIYGQEDIWSSPNEYIMRIVPNAKIIILPGKDHDVHDFEVQQTLNAEMLAAGLCPKYPDLTYK